MILAYAGRRSQSLGGDPEAVRRRIHALLADSQPRWVVGAAADGADLILLEEALADPNGPRVHVILPTLREVFAEDSVEAGWRDRFEAVLGVVAGGRGEIVSLGMEPGEAAYRAANAGILQQAEDLREEGELALVLVVARAGEGRMVQDLEDRARARGVATMRIDPADA